MCVYNIYSFESLREANGSVPPIFSEAPIIVPACGELCISKVTLDFFMGFPGKGSPARRYNVTENNIFHPAHEHMADTFTRSGVKDAIGENGIKGCRARRSGMM